MIRFDISKESSLPLHLQLLDELRHKVVASSDFSVAKENRVLRSTGEMRLDRRGRKRPVKRKVKLALLVALGVWPSGAWDVLDWALAEGETSQAWEALLVRLEQRGLYRQRG